MKLRIEADGTPVTTLLGSITVTRELSGRTSTAEFRIPISPLVGTYDSAVYDESTYGDSSTPAINQQSVIEIYNDDTDDLIFAGLIVRVAREQKSKSLQFWACTAADWAILLENRVVNRSWTGKTDAEIIQDAFGDVCPEIDVSGIDTLSVAINFDAKDLSLRELLERLATISGAEWYVTPAKVLVWRSEGSVTAPFGISNQPDNSSTFAWRNFRPDRRSIGFANRVTVLGAFTGTGGAELRSVAENSTSIDDLGLREAIVVARDVDNQTALDLAASIELEKRAVQESIVFELDRASLEVGQLIHIESFPAGIDGDYVIQTLKFRQRSQQDTVYEATVGDYRGRLRDRLRQLDRIKNGPKLQPAPPPPPNSVGEGQLKDSAVTRLKIAAQAVNTAQLEVAAVTDSILAASAVTNTKIADDAISTPKLQAGSITSTTLATGSVVAGKVAANAIVGSNIQAGTITAADAVFASSAIVSADIANAAITNAKIDTVSASKLTAGTIDASVITVTNLNASNITAGSLDVARISAGTITGTKLANGTITATQIANATITDTQIANATITSAKIVSLDASKIAAGTISASVSMTSPSLTISASPVTINIDSSNYIKVTNSSAGTIAKLSGSLELSQTSGSRNVRVNMLGLWVTNSSGNDIVVAGNGSEHGFMNIMNSSGTLKVAKGVDGNGDGYVSFNNSANYAVWTGSNKKKIAAGVVQITGSSTSVNTGLSSIDSVVATLATGGTSTDTVTTSGYSGGTVTLYTTSGSNPFCAWIAFGTA